MQTDYVVFGAKSRLRVGKDCNLVNTLFNTACGTITLGNYVFFGHNAMVLTGTHDYEVTDMKRRFSYQDYQDNHIVIEDGVWIASGAIIIGPCTIGKNSVVGAGSVVRPGVYPERSLIAGNPAKIIRTIDVTEE